MNTNTDLFVSFKLNKAVQYNFLSDNNILLQKCNKQKESTNAFNKGNFSKIYKEDIVKNNNNNNKADILIENNPFEINKKILQNQNK